MTWGGSEAEEDLRKRRGFRAIVSRFLSARARIAWCIVGTAVYQVGRVSSIHEKNLRALNPGVQQTDAPAESDARTAAMRP
jgi:hypothetical protein